VKKDKWAEEQLKSWVSLAYRTGIGISLAIVLVGFIILIHISGFSNIQPLVRLEQIPAAIVISIGILLLLLLPLIQVTISIIFFSVNRNKLFIGISVAVFCLAAVSMVLALI
jgi:uncharacterized membrane protein